MPESNLRATLHTSMGDINVILFPDQAPKTVKVAAPAAAAKSAEDDEVRSSEARS